MHQTLKVSPDQTLYYRYNPQNDVLALRFEPRFEATREAPLEDLPEVSLSHDADGGQCVGLRIEGVQQLLLRALARDVFNMARPHLEAAGAIAAQPASAAEPIPEYAPPQARTEKAPQATNPDAAATSQVTAASDRSNSSPSTTESSSSTNSNAASPASSHTQPSQAAVASNAATETAVAQTRTSASDNSGNDDEDSGRDKPKKRRRRRRKKNSGDESSADADLSGPSPQAESDAGPQAASDQDSRGSSRNDRDREVAREVPSPSASSLPDSAPVADEAPESAPVSAPAPSQPIRPAATAAPPAITTPGHKAGEAPKKLSPAAAHAARYMAELAEADAEADQTAEAAPAETSAEASSTNPSQEAAPIQPAADSAPAEAPTADRRPSANSESAPATQTTPAATPPPPAPPAESQAGPADSVDRRDGNSDALSPAFSDLGLHPSIGRAIADLGFETPTPIQVKAIPVAITGRDVVGLAQTGTGKTLAFVAPGLHRILADPSGGHVPRMLILAPTRELCVQVAEEAERLSAQSGLRVTMIYGGVGMGPQIRDLERGVDLIVATPGRMLDHLRRGNASISKVQTLVLDEADRMLDMGFLPDVRAILRFMPAERQTLFFTATMPPEIESLSMEFQTNPVKVEIARRKPPEAIDQLLYPVGKHLKTDLLVHLLENDKEMKSCLIFTERKVDADVLHRKLRQHGIKVAVMHGDRRQQDRERALSDLASGKVQVLVATNVAARGLDIDDISHVVNYDVPQTVDEYVHRIGRTARAEADGSAWTFVTVSDEVMVDRIEDALEKKLPRILDPDFDYDVPTPAWAKPSAKDVMAMLSRSQSVADRMRGIRRGR